MIAAARVVLPGKGGHHDQRRDDDGDNRNDDDDDPRIHAPSVALGPQRGCRAGRHGRERGAVARDRRGPAPHHVWVAAAIGLVASLAGVVATLTHDMGPLWYPVALAVTTLPCAWLGGALRARQA